MARAGSRSAELGQSGAHLRELCLERGRPDEVVAAELELAPELLLVNAEEEVAESPVHRIVEVVGRERGELGQQGRVADDGGEEIALTLHPCLEHARRR